MAAGEALESFASPSALSANDAEELICGRGVISNVFTALGIRQRTFERSTHEQVVPKSVASLVNDAERSFDAHEKEEVSDVQEAARALLPDEKLLQNEEAAADNSQQLRNHHDS